jgi:hypothetical protein
MKTATDKTENKTNKTTNNRKEIEAEGSGGREGFCNQDNMRFFYT